ncbi:MAG: MlaD family protein [Tannerella sp.]|jgi:phospholipid/cholesterol/gamma-HCH transport system substrate-binding protein|nr:MlaD family protein [Tannerella sp.]
MEKNFSKEIKIGIATILSLTLLYIGVNYLKGINLFKPANYYYVSCNNVKDITISSPVFVDGFKVGLVRSIAYDYSSVNKITLEIGLDKEMKINKGSYVSIESTLLSGAELSIKLNNDADEYYKPGDMLEGRIKSGMVSSVEENILPLIVDMIPKIDSILTGLQTLVNSTELSQSLSNLENTTKQLEASSIRLNAFLKNDVPEISSGLKTTASNLSIFSSNLNNLDLEESIHSFNSTLGNINTMALKLNSNDNSLGLLLNDSLLYNNLNRTVENASGLLFDVKQNPKKYVRFSLF